MIDMEEELEQIEDENDGLEAIETERLMQLQDLLMDMKMEVMVSEYEEAPVLRIWPKAGEEELDVYLRYHLWNADEGIFLLEALVPMGVWIKDEAAGLALCMKHNRDSLLSTAWLEDERFYLRLVYRESGYPIGREEMGAFLRDLAEECQYFRLLSN